MSLAAFTQPGRFHRGNLHTHSTRSDGAWPVEEVVGFYRRAGYDFLCLTDHFLAEYGFPITDTAAFRRDDFTPILGAELHAPRTAKGHDWHIVAVGLPADFAPTAADETGPALAARAAAAGAFVGIAHPSWYGLSPEDALSLDAAHAVEVYNHTAQLATDRGESWWLADELLARGRMLAAYAADDAHFHHGDGAGGWVQVKAVDREPATLVAALRAGAFYASQGPEIRDLALVGTRLEVACTPARSIVVVGAGWESVHAHGLQLTRATLDLAPLASPWARLIVTDPAGRRAWTGPFPIR